MNRRIVNIVLSLAAVAAIALLAGCKRSQSSGPALPTPQAAGKSLPTAEMPTLTPAAPVPATATPQPPAPAPTVAPVAPTTAPQPAAQPTAAPAQPTAAPSSGPRTHVVKPGEWVYSIARLYNVSPYAIVQANQIVNPNRLYPGQVLTIPGGGPAPAPAPGSCSSPYTVLAGDTIYSIGRKCGKTPAAIVTANNLVNPNLIFVGQKLQIP